MKLRILATLLASLSAPAVYAAAADPLVPTEPEQFQVTQRTEVPNTVLQPGTYSIRILDHLRDRVILQVSGKNHVESTFIAIPASTMANAPVGPIAYGSGPKGKAAMKGFSFPGGTAVEFVYPKTAAVGLAQANGTRVMAIDPASEGRVTAEKLSGNDMQMITLWMLEPTRVGPNDAKPGIAAAKYQAPQPAATAPVQVAQVQSPSPAPSPAIASAPDATAPSNSSLTSNPTSSPAPSPAPTQPVRRQRPVQIARNDTPAPPPPAPARTRVRPAGVTALPHTASDLPLLWLGAFVSLLTATLLRARRLAVGN